MIVEKRFLTGVISWYQPIIRTLEIGLVAGFLIHIIQGLYFGKQTMLPAQ